MEKEIIRIPVKTYYLQMTERINLNAVNLPNETLLLKAESPTINFYKFLFTSLGGEWGWTSRLIISDEDLITIISNSQIEIYVLYVRGVPAGFFELNRDNNNGVELSYFGLFREFLGKGYGKLFLNLVLEKAWAPSTKRVWLHTCEYDHKNALPLYLKTGFKIYDERIDYELYPVDFLVKRGIQY
jgi:GNAT superfamily N-acetyltransferase